MSNEKLIVLKQMLLKLFYLTLLFKILVILVSVYNTVNFSYASLDSRKLSSFYFLDKLAQINYLVFVAYLILFPNKKELIPVLKIYLLLYTFSLLGGARGDMMYFVLFVFSYLLFRDYISKKEGNLDQVILTKKVRIIVFSILPFFLVFLSLFASIRVGGEVSSEGFVQDLMGFFVQQGGSTSVIGYAKEYETSFPDTNLSYTFGPLIAFFKYGFLSKIGGASELTDMSLIPLYSNNMGATITWIVSPDYYYLGGGFGTQYIAELYKDFGYIGVALFSFILGVLMTRMTFSYFTNWKLNVLFSLSIVSIYSMPRDFYLTWLSNIISVLNILFLLSLDTYANRKIHKKKKMS